MNREQLISKLEAKYTNLRFRTTEEFDGTKGGIWTSGESGELAEDKFPLFNCYSEDYKEVRYQFGVHKEVRAILEPLGWYCEWYDAGTVFIFEE